MPTITVNGAAIAVTESGTGAPLLALHSSAASGRQWRALADLIGDRFRVIAPDLYGYGESASWPGEDGPSLADEAAAVWPLIEERAPVHVAGHSYGGAVALTLALAHPGAVLSLAVYEPVAFWLLSQGNEDDQAMLAEVLDFARAMDGRIGRGDEAGAMAAFVDLWNSPGAFAALPPEKQADLALKARKVVDDFAALTTAPVALAAFRALTMPALVMRGSASPAASRRIAGMLAAALPGARLAEIEGCGHMGPVTQPGPVNAAMKAHLDSLAEGNYILDKCQSI